MRKDYQLITMDYAEGGDLIIYCRDRQRNKEKKRITSFKPYFGFDSPIEPLVPTPYEILTMNQRAEALSHNLRETEQITIAVTRNPGDVKKLRGLFNHTWVANVNYKRRLIIDIGLFNGFSAPSSFEIDYREIEPIEYTDTPRFCVIDLEMDSLNKIPSKDDPTDAIVCYTIYDSYNNKYLTVKLHDEDKTIVKDPSWVQILLNSETKLLMFLNSYLERYKPDILSGWNIDVFDVPYLLARAEKLGVTVNLEGCSVFDLIEPFRRIRGQSLGNRLKDVAVEEFNLSPDELVSDEYHSEFWFDKSKHDILMAYNRDDVKFCVELIKKYDIINFFWFLKAGSGMEDINANNFTQLIDTLLLRISPYVLPTSSSDESNETLEGAIVLEPKIGIYNSVACFDFSMQYPWHIIKYQLSPELMNYPLEERLKMEPGIVPKLCLYLMKQRLKVEKDLKYCQDTYGVDSDEARITELRRNVTKFMLNAVYGQLLYKRCRIYDSKTMDTMLALTRETLLYAKLCIEKHGYEVIGGDTDGLFAKIAQDKVKELLAQLRADLTEYAKSKGISDPFEIKNEWYAATIGFVKKKDAKEGAKKKYFMRLIEKDGKKCDLIKIKGFEAIRGDQSKLTKNLQKECFKAIFDGTTDDFAAKVKQTIADIKADKIPLDDLATRVNLNKSLAIGEDDSYKSNTEYVKGARYAQEKLGLNIGKGDRVKMLFVHWVEREPGIKDQTDVVCFFDADKLPPISLDKEKIIERTIKGKIEGIMELTGWNWNKIIGRKSLMDYAK